jgi:hypothetical protein
MAVAPGGLRPHPVLRPQVRILRLRLVGRRRSSGRSLPVGTRARDGRRAGSPAGSRHDLRRWRDAHQAGRRPALAVDRDDPAMAGPDARRRVDGGGQSGDARCREGRYPGRGGCQPGEPGRPVVPARVAPGPGAPPWPARGGTGRRNRPSPILEVVARPDFRRARLDAGRLANRPRYRPRFRPRASLLLRSGLREGYGPLETTAARRSSG